jgi:hypothetical protein
MTMSIDEELYEIFYGLCPSVQRGRASGRLPMPGEPPVRVDQVLRESFAQFLDEGPLPCPDPVCPEVVVPADPILLVQLEACLDQHDWYCSFSDDARVYRAGQASWDRIERLVEQTGREGEAMRDERMRQVNDTIRNAPEP